MDVTEFHDVKRVIIDKHRWYATLEIEDAEGHKVFYFSADSGVTDGDGLFFGTAEDYEAAETW